MGGTNWRRQPARPLDEPETLLATAGKIPRSRRTSEVLPDRRGEWSRSGEPPDARTRADAPALHVRVRAVDNTLAAEPRREAGTERFAKGRGRSLPHVQIDV